jgi:hypothetical protein
MPKLYFKVIESVGAASKSAALIQQADRLLCESWNERIWSDGEPINPSLTVDQTVNGAFSGWKSSVHGARRRTMSIWLPSSTPPTTFVHKLASRLRCRKCTKTGRRPSGTLLQLTWQPRHLRTEV